MADQDGGEVKEEKAATGEIPLPLNLSFPSSACPHAAADCLSVRRHAEAVAICASEVTRLLAEELMKRHMAGGRDAHVLPFACTQGSCGTDCGCTCPPARTSSSGIRQARNPQSLTGLLESSFPGTKPTWGVHDDVAGASGCTSTGTSWGGDAPVHQCGGVVDETTCGKVHETQAPGLAPALPKNTPEANMSCGWTLGGTSSQNRCRYLLDAMLSVCLQLSMRDQHHSKDH